MSLAGAFGWFLLYCEDCIRGFTRLHYADCIIYMGLHCLDCLMRLLCANYFVGFHYADYAVRLNCADLDCFLQIAL